MAAVQLLDEYLTKADLAEQLGKCERTIERWNRERTGPPPTIIGSQKYYHIDDVKDWVNAGRPNTKARKARRK